MDSFRNRRVLACISLLFFGINLQASTFSCSTTAEIQVALATVVPGDTIVINPGTYTGPLVSVNGKSVCFGSSQAGLPDAPITIRSANASSMAVLVGTNTASNYVFYLYNAPYWIIQDLKITGAQKGIVIDKSSFTRIVHCEVSAIGQEGVHFRDGSSNCRLEDSAVHDTGLVTAGYGEAVYIGTDRGSWTTFNHACHDNIVSGCMLGPNVAAEHVDIKEGTQRTIIEHCILNGTGISGANAATSFIDCKGVDAIIRYNTGYRNGNTIIDSAFHCSNRGVGDSGTGNWFYHNTLNMDDATAYIVRTTEGTCTYKVWSNTRNPAGNMYQAYSGSSYTEADPGGTVTTVPTTAPTPEPTQSILSGDVNGSGAIDIIDALLIAQYLVGLNPANFYATAADVNADNTINIIDALRIAQYVVGLLPAF